MLHKRELSRPFLIIISLPHLYSLRILEEEVRFKGREVLKPVKALLKVEVINF
jgi:hypothetical protein